MDRTLVLTFDIGTTAVKTMLWDDTLACLRASSVDYLLTVDGPRVSCDPETYRSAMRAGAAAVLDDAVRERVRAITLTTQGETLVVTDAGGRARGDAIVWLDTRAAREAEELAARWDRTAFARATGIPALDATAPLAKAAHLVRTGELGPDDRILLLEDHLLAWLSGRIVTTASLQTSTGWFDLVRDDYSDNALTAAGITRTQLPELVPSGTSIGELLPEPAAELGLPAGVQLVSGAMDQAAAAIGLGATDDDVAAVTLGTALVVAVTRSDPADAAERGAVVYRHALDGKYLVLSFDSAAGATLAWWRRVLDTDTTGHPGYAELDVQAAAEPAGSRGVLAVLGSSPDDAVSMTLVGLSPAATAGTVARSLMEASAFAVRHALDGLGRAGVAPTELRLGGGGARGVTLPRIIGEVTGLALTRVADLEGSSAGAALLGCWGSGLVPRGHDPRALAPTRQTPDPAAVADYGIRFTRHQERSRAIRAALATPPDRPGER